MKYRLTIAELDGGSPDQNWDLSKEDLAAISNLLFMGVDSIDTVVPDESPAREPMAKALQLSQAIRDFIEGEKE